LSNSIRFIALNALGDEFQEIVYTDLSIDHSSRAALWAKLQDKYTPGVDYGKFDKGYQWQTKSLFFSHPFYTIEYALAQFAAYEFYFMYKENPEETFDRYVEFCKLGGRYTFSEALKYAGLKNPFEEETVKELTEKVEALINSYDDSKF
jgi:oligoendopeptidase F